MKLLLGSGEAASAIYQQNKKYPEFTWFGPEIPFDFHGRGVQCSSNLDVISALQTITVSDTEVQAAVALPKRSEKDAPGPATTPKFELLHQFYSWLQALQIFEARGAKLVSLWIVFDDSFGFEDTVAFQSVYHFVSMFKFPMGLGVIPKYGESSFENIERIYTNDTENVRV